MVQLLKTSFSLFFFLLCCFVYGGQELLLRQLTSTDGLSQSSVVCIHQDKEGFIWIGTNDGLNRYDGTHFKIFRYDAKDSASISDSYITDIQEDTSGNLWIATRHGANIYNKYTQQFTRIFLHPYDLNNQYKVIDKVYIAPEGQVYFFSGGVIYRLLTPVNLLSKGVQQRVEVVFKDSANGAAYDMYVDNRGEKWIASSSGLLRLDKSAKRELFTYHDNNWGTRSTAVKQIIPSPKNKNLLWLILENNIVLFDKQQRRILRDAGEDRPNRDFTIFKVISSRQGNLWVASNDGVFTFDDEGFILRSKAVLSAPGKSTGREGVVWGFMEDRSGLIWAGTADAGVYILNPGAARFEKISAEFPTNLKLPHAVVWSVMQDSYNRLWVGTASGLVVYETLNGGLKPLLPFTNQEYRNVPDHPAAAYFRGRPVTSLFEDKEGVVWIGVSKQGLYRYDPLTKNIRSFRSQMIKELGDESKSNILSITGDSKGNLLLGTWIGMVVYNKKQDRFYYPRGMEPYRDGLFSGFIFRVYEDKKGLLWISSIRGLYSYDPLSKKVNAYMRTEENKENPNMGMVTCVHEDRKGNLWITTLGGGLYKFDKAVGKVSKKYGVEDGLPNEVLYGLLDDSKGYLWLATNSGLSRFNPSSEEFINYSVADGLPSNEFNQNAYIKSRRGELIFGTINGIVVFDPLSFKHESLKVSVMLNDIKFNYRSWSKSDDQNHIIRGTPTVPGLVELTYADKAVSFDFVASYFNNPEKLRYAYMLKGFDEEWIYSAPGETIASYTSLPPGNYEFLVKASVTNLFSSVPNLQIRIIVLPPFWLTWWFISLASAGLVAVIVFVVLFYFRQKLRKKQRELELVGKIYDERERISRDLHDNIGSQLTYIISTLDHIGYKAASANDFFLVKKINSLNGFARSTMQQLRETIWAMKKEFISIEEFKDKLYQYVAHAGESGCDVQLHAELSEKRVSERLKPSQAVHLFRICQEAVNNSLKHSGATMINVHMRLEGDSSLYLRVTDNGCGFNLSEKEQIDGHEGLKNINRRVKELGGRLDIRAKKDEGTTVSVKLGL